MINNLTTQARNFHPFYADVMDLGFDIYMMQQFLSDDKQLEIYLSTYDDGIFKPENGGHFISTNEYVRDNHKKTIDANDITLELAFIGVKNNTQKGIGTQLLGDICELADKYNFEIQLDIDTKFGTPYHVLRTWYERLGFQYLFEKKMIRFRKSKRMDTKLFEFPKRYQSVVKYACNVNEIASTDDGYTEELKNDFKEMGQRVKAIASKKQLTYIDCYILHHDIDGSDMVVLDDDGHPLLEECVQWLKCIVKK